MLSLLPLLQRFKSLYKSDSSRENLSIISDFISNIGKFMSYETINSYMPEYGVCIIYKQITDNRSMILLVLQDSNSISNK